VGYAPVFLGQEVLGRMRKITDRWAWFWGLVDRSGGDDACWPWTRSCNDGGYGTARVGKKFHLAHRYCYELLFGAPAAGLEVRHSCDNPPCCNPKHLVLGTHSDNMRDCVERGRDPRASKTHCVNGHAFTPQNTLVVYGPNGRAGRHCRTCTRERMRRYRAAGE
jgi:hypothetical protein